MALGGGVYTEQNKILPGTYVNFVSKNKALGKMGERGSVAIALCHGWGDEGSIIEVTRDNFEKDCYKNFGCSCQSSYMKPIREILKGANKVYVHIMAVNTTAKVKGGEATYIAMQPGMLGNEMSVKVIQDMDNEKYFWVKVYMGLGKVQVYETYTNDSGAKFETNDYIDIDFDDVLSAGNFRLSGGTTKQMHLDMFYDFFIDVERYTIDTIIFDSVYDKIFSDVAFNFVKRMREENGVKMQYVTRNNNNYNYEGVVSLDITSESFAYWVAGQLAGAQTNESLTNKLYDGEYNQYISHSKIALENAIKAGIFVMYKRNNEIRVLKDINTYVDIQPGKTEEFSNNQVIRVLDRIAVDIASIFDKFYLGKTQNNDIGRDLFKAELINYHNMLQGIQAIENFDSADIEVTQGDEKGTVIVSEFIQPIAAMDKLYMKCTLN